MRSISRNGIITLSSGDYCELPLLINDGGTLDIHAYELGEGDKVYFSITEPNQPFERGVVRKILTKDDLDEDGRVTIRLYEEDTECLLPGRYYYEIRLLMSRDGKEYASTIVPKRRMNLL